MESTPFDPDSTIGHDFVVSLSESSSLLNKNQRATQAHCSIQKQAPEHFSSAHAIVSPTHEMSDELDSWNLFWYSDSLNGRVYVRKYNSMLVRMWKPMFFSLKKDRIELFSNQWQWEHDVEPQQVIMLEDGLRVPTSCFRTKEGKKPRHSVSNLWHKISEKARLLKSRSVSSFKIFEILSIFYYPDNVDGVEKGTRLENWMQHTKFGSESSSALSLLMSEIKKRLSEPDETVIETEQSVMDCEQSVYGSMSLTSDD